MRVPHAKQRKAKHGYPIPRHSPPARDNCLAEYRAKASLTPLAIIAALIVRPIVLLWPLGGMVDAIRNFSRPYAKPAFWLFCIYFGFVFIYGDPFSEGGKDATRYAAKLIEMHRTQVPVHELTSQFYVQGSKTMDVYNDLITWTVSRFTGDPRWLFTVYAVVFGFFFCQNLWLVFETVNTERKLGAVWWLCVGVLLLVNPIWYINGVRMYTAAHVFCYGILLFFLKRKWYGALWAASAMLIHFSFILLIPVFLVFLLFPKNLSVLISLFFVCAFADFFDLSAVRHLLSFMPDIYEDRMAGYARDARAELVSQTIARLSFHVRWSSNSQRIILYIFALLPYLHRKLWAEKRPLIKNLYGFALFLGAFAFLFDHVPSAGRFLTVVGFLMAACFVILLSDVPFAAATTPWLFWFCPVIVFWMLFQLRVGVDNIGPLLIIGNPLLAIVVKDQTTLLNYVKWWIGF